MSADVPLPRELADDSLPVGTLAGRQAEIAQARRNCGDRVAERALREGGFATGGTVTGRMGNSGALDSQGPSCRCADCMRLRQEQRDRLESGTAKQAPVAGRRARTTKVDLIVPVPARKISPAPGAVRAPEVLRLRLDLDDGTSIDHATLEQLKHAIARAAVDVLRRG